MDEVVVVKKRCPLCGLVNEITVPRAGYERWRAGEFIQVALAGMSADDREGLLSGTHGRCFDAAFPEDD